ncbi:MAG: hypothetical protein KME16_09905 [Scytolyngbya sp. HA4215-MV1]|jgi:hypothetical protein|nr:hypothetical protein [Scytolyngbya sp. HA4215-MV1]
MTNLIWQNGIIGASFVACIAGLTLIFSTSSKPADEIEATDRILLMMSFTYWLVYCVAFGLQKLVAADWEMVLFSLKLTTIMTYFLTFTCVLSLPLHRFAASQRIQE